MRGWKGGPWNPELLGELNLKGETSDPSSNHVHKPHFQLIALIVSTLHFRISPNLTNMIFNPFIPNAPFLYPLKASENLAVFWCFQGLEKGCIGNELVELQRILFQSFAMAYQDKTYDLMNRVVSWEECRNFWQFSRKFRKCRLKFTSASYYIYFFCYQSSLTCFGRNVQFVLSLCYQNLFVFAFLKGCML